MGKMIPRFECVFMVWWSVILFVDFSHSRAILIGRVFLHRYHSNGVAQRLSLRNVILIILLSCVLVLVLVVSFNCLHRLFFKNRRHEVLLFALVIIWMSLSNEVI